MARWMAHQMLVSPLALPGCSGRLCEEGSVLYHQVAALGPFIYHRTGTDGGLASSLLVTSEVREGPLNYSGPLAPHLKNACRG